MSIVAALGKSASAVVRPRRPAGPGCFHVADDADLHAFATASAAAPAPVGLHTLLVLQEAEADAVQDRAARRHAGSMLTELSAVQHALLRGNAPGISAALRRLSDLTRGSPAALDPRLAAVVRAIAMRAAVEAARHTPQPPYPAATG